MVGLGYQEMIYSYLGARADFADRMLRDGAGLVEIANPMSESFDVLRDSIIPNLLASEAVSANAAYPHRIFEVGKTVVKDTATTRARGPSPASAPCSPTGRRGSTTSTRTCSPSASTSTSSRRVARRGPALHPGPGRGHLRRLAGRSA